MVPKPLGSDVPAAAVGVPMTGGQYVAHVPLQFDVVGVSMANQYRVWPWELVSTVPTPVLPVEMTALDAVVAGEVACDCGVVLVPAAAPPELLAGDDVPQAVMITAAPASTGAAHQRLRMSHISDRGTETFLCPHYVARCCPVHPGSSEIRWHSQARDIGYL
jgi:hypothetical protein